jgi:hypothetical protein
MEGRLTSPTVSLALAMIETYRNDCSDGLKAQKATSVLPIGTKFPWTSSEAVNAFPFAVSTTLNGTVVELNPIHATTK